MSESDTVMVRPKRIYTEEDGSWKSPGGDAYPVSRQHAADLQANDLVEIEEAGAKAAPEPLNKMAPMPANKAKG